ncbi:MAG TPA: hypothetical protein VGN23_12175 [Verrucomicrobiae bacterium]
MRFIRLASTTFLFALYWAGPVCADQVVMLNGDVLNGSVLSANTNAVTLQNSNLGTVVLPRAKISSINFGAATTGVTPGSITTTPAPSVSDTNTDMAAMLRGLQSDSNLVQQVQSQILGSASPDAVKKFNDMLNGLSTGQIDMTSLRQQAQSEADELRSLKKDLGPNDTGEVDSYLAILDDFLQETAPTNSRATLSQTNSIP